MSHVGPTLVSIGVQEPVDGSHDLPPTNVAFVLLVHVVSPLLIAGSASRAEVPNVVLPTLASGENVVPVQEGKPTVTLSVKIAVQSTSTVLSENDLGSLKAAVVTLAAVIGKDLHPLDGILSTLVNHRFPRAATAGNLGDEITKDLRERNLAENGRGRIVTDFVHVTQQPLTLP
jgi:hypothetical protein